MMSEKRFNIAYGGNVITDEDGRDLDLTVKWCVEELVGLLNKQQATINELKERNAHNFAKKTVLQYQIMNNDTDLNENEVVDLLNRQTKLISAYKYEFAKLQMEKNNLKEENEQLKQTINSQQLTITNKQSIIKELFEQKGFCEKMAQNPKNENEQLRKIGVIYQGHNPCEICTYSLENKVCCADPIPISCDDAKKNFIQGLCKKHKQIVKSIRRYDDEI